MRSLAENSAKKEGYQSVKLYNPNDTLMGLNTKELALQVRQKTDESKPNERTKVPVSYTHLTLPTSDLV